MSRKNNTGNPSLAFDLDSAPPLPTAVRARLTKGRLISADPDGGLWLFRKVPDTPMETAKSLTERFAAGGPLMKAFEETAQLSQSMGGRRGIAKSTYREIQLFATNVPTYYDPGNHPNRDWLLRMMGNKEVPQRSVLFGVKLVDSLGTGKGFKDTVKSLAEQWQQRTVPVDAFNKDYQRVHTRLTRAGLGEPAKEDFDLIESWWNHGGRQDTPFLPHLDHMHVFPDSHQMKTAAKVGLDDCEEWEQHGLHVPALTFMTVNDINFRFEDPRSDAVLWVPALFREGAVAVSVRGLVEPAVNTRKQLIRNKDKHTEDIRERFEAGKHSKEEQQRLLDDLEETEKHYAIDGKPTLLNASVVTAFSGMGYDPEVVSDALGFTSVESMEKRQPNAWREMLLASTTRANPKLHDLPVQTLAHAGFQSLATVGDDPMMAKSNGQPHASALIGFTEADHQPAYVSVSASSATDAYPFMLLAGATRSGKTMALLWLAFQWADQGAPVIVVDPKPHNPSQKEAQGFSVPVRRRGGQVFSLSELLEVDGVFDPMRTALRPEEGLLSAASLLGRINPFGGARADLEADLRAALDYGVKQGATCTGQALKIADANEACPPQVFAQVKKVLDADPVFRALVGMDPRGETLRVSNRLSLIEAGSFPLELPDPGVNPYDPDLELGQRITAGLVSAMVRGSTTALSGRDGAVMLDEAWMFLAAGFTEVERLGRLAASQRVFPVLATQRVSDARDAGLAGYISRGLILHLPEEEAYAAAELFKVEPTPEMIKRISAPEWLGDTTPNWESLRALWDKKGAGRKNLRGSVAYYIDLDGRMAPTVVSLPPPFLDEVSTNSMDVDARAAAQGAQGMPQPALGGAV